MEKVSAAPRRRFIKKNVRFFILQHGLKIYSAPGHKKKSPASINIKKRVGAVCQCSKYKKGDPKRPPSQSRNRLLRAFASDVKSYDFYFSVLLNVLTRKSTYLIGTYGVSPMVEPLVSIFTALFSYVMETFAF